MAERMDRIEITMYEIKTSLKAIQPRNQSGKLAMSEASNLTTRPEKGKAPARPDTYPPVDSTNVTSKPEPDSIVLTPGEKFVKEAWPQALLAHEVNHEAYTSIKNKVIIRPELRLDKANSTVFSKLAEIQSVFRIALVPYWYWPQRLCLDMKEDFQCTRVWAEENPATTWPLLLEAIFKTMQRLDVLHSPRTIFSRLAARDGEDVKSFTTRIRECYYGLSKQDRGSNTTRDTLSDITKTYLPHIWTHLQPMMVGRSNSDGVKLLVQIATRISKWPAQANLCVSAYTNSSSKLMISDPRQNQPLVFPIQEKADMTSPKLECSFPVRDGSCAICKKMGHWARECPKNNYTKQVPPHYKQDTGKGKYGNFKKKFSALLDKSRNQKQPQHIGRPGNRGTYLINSIDPEETSGDYDNADCFPTDDELEKFFDELEEEHPVE
ncbi:Bgt-20623 [Blumeria graminis f. sp. tritici]|uniref:Bgt-20623 n=1 Tax=Blumeria graminis f. sp. tritici TaxID=62690 RepID=A0A9X9MF97_BLUGR|nr:Bgt-20623 [Blumeria graminis f. sp. tritici]